MMERMQVCLEEETFMERQDTRPRRKRCKQDGYFQRLHCERLRHLEPSDRGCPERFGTRLLPQEENTDHPRTIYRRNSITWVRSSNVIPVERSEGLDYTAEKVVMDRALLPSSFPQRGYRDSPSYSHFDQPADDVVLDIPFSQPNFPHRRNRYDDHAAEDVVSKYTQETRKRFYSPSRRDNHLSEEVVLHRSQPIVSRRKYCDSPSSQSYSNFRPDLRRYDSYYDEARRPRNFGRKRFNAKHWEDTKEHDWHHSQRSAKKRSRFSPKRGFKKPMEKPVKSSSRLKLQINETQSSMLENRPDNPQDLASEPISKSVISIKKSDTKCLEKDGELRSATHTLKSAKDDGEANRKKQGIIELFEARSAKFSKKVAINFSEDDAGTLTKDSGTKNLENNAEANFTKKSTITKSSEMNAEGATLSKKLGDKFSKDALTNDIGTEFYGKDDEVYLTKKPAITKSSEEFAEVDKLSDQLGDKSSKDNAVANVTENQALMISSEDNVVARLSENLPKKPSKDVANANFEQEIVAEVREDNAEVDLAKMPSKTFFEHNVEGNLAKTIATTVFAENGAADILQKATEVKSLESDQKGAQYKDQNVDIPHVSSLDCKDSGTRYLNAMCPPKEDDAVCYFRLMIDKKFICYTKCTNPPIQIPSSWNVVIVRRSVVKGVSQLPQFILLPAIDMSREKYEWNNFLGFLHKHDRVAVVKFETLKIYVLPAMPTEIDGGLYFKHAVVAYDLQELCDTSLQQMHLTSARCGPIIKTVSSPSIAQSMLLNEVKESAQSHSNPPGPHSKVDAGFDSDAYVKGSSVEKGTCSSISKCHEAVNSFHPLPAKEDISGERNFVCVDPSYLKTLGQAHSGWIFGAIAELVDNSRDAEALRLDIAIENVYDKRADIEIPMLCIIDDGVGMDHDEILRMISFGHKQPVKDNFDHIGRFGVGFKTGAMRLGKDALVLTQTTKSCSVAFLSQSMNERRDNLEIPVVSYRRQAQCMEIDLDVQSEELAKYNLNAMKEWSPFNEYLIGEKTGLFRGNTGTQIYIWNLDKWGPEYTLEWQAGLRGGSSFHKGDIFVRSRRVRTRPGQTSQKVHLDYSLRSYMEVIYLEPRMKIYVQGSLVRSRPLAKSLNNTAVINDKVMGKQVQLTLGRCQIEWDEGNGGIFLYWHGRLIEAYKRVGGMLHSADIGRGVIGVIDVTQLMDDGNGSVWVHGNKQAFQDCEPYAFLEKWMGDKADEYWDKHFDLEQLEKINARYKPDNEWVQCDKCRKWRILNAGFDSRFLPKEWFCYMEPFNGRCEIPEQKLGCGVFTVGLKRSSCNDRSTAADCEESEDSDSDGSPAQGKSKDELSEPDKDEVQHHTLKRLRRGPPQSVRRPLPL